MVKLKVCDGCDILRQTDSGEYMCDETGELVDSMEYCPEGNDTISIEIYWEDLNLDCQQRLREMYEWIGFELDDFPQGPICELVYEIQ